MLRLTAVFSHRAVQDLINVQPGCPWQVCHGRTSAGMQTDREGKEERVERQVEEEGGQERRGEGKEGGEIRAAHCFSITLWVLPAPGFPNKFLIAVTFYFSPGWCEVTALFVMLIMSSKPRAAARHHEGW